MKVRGNKVVHSENGSIIFLGKGLQEIPHVLVGLRRVNMTAPKPFGIVPALEVQQSQRLRVMHNNVIVLLLEKLGERLWEPR